MDPYEALVRGNRPAPLNPRGSGCSPTALRGSGAEDYKYTLIQAPWWSTKERSGGEFGGAAGAVAFVVQQLKSRLDHVETGAPAGWWEDFAVDLFRWHRYATVLSLAVLAGGRDAVSREVAGFATTLDKAARFAEALAMGAQDVASKRLRDARNDFWFQPPPAVPMPGGVPTILHMDAYAYAYLALGRELEPYFAEYARQVKETAEKALGALVAAVPSWAWLAGAGLLMLAVYVRR